MNNVLKKTGMMMALAAIISLGASCSDDNNENQGGDNALSVNEQKMEAIANQYVLIPYTRHTGQSPMPPISCMRILQLPLKSLKPIHKV